MLPERILKCRIPVLIAFVLMVPWLSEAQTLTDTVQFSFGENGGVVLTPTPGAQATVGYAKIQPAQSSPTPSMVEILGFRSNNILIDETVIPSAPLISTGRLFVKTASPHLTGAAFANPNNQAAVVSFYFTDQNGTDSGAGTLNVSANGQLAIFFNQAPFAGAPLLGTLTFSSTVPLSVVGLHGFINERGDFLITPPPATGLTSTTNPVIIPHWADGGGYQERIVLINPTNASIMGTTQFLLGSGAAATLTVNGTTNTSFPYTIPPKSVVELVSSNPASVQVGSVRITPTGGTDSPAAFGMLTYKSTGITVTEAVFPASSAGGAFRMYVENGPGLLAGVAFANPSAAQITVDFSLSTLSGTSMGQVSTMLGPNAQQAKFISELFPGMPTTFQGILRISTSAASGVVAEGLRIRFNERGELLLSGVPAIPESGVPDTIVPHVVAGGGWNSQLILFSRTAGQTNSGNINFIGQSGAPMLIMDVTPPTVSVTGPGDNSTVGGTVNVMATAGDNVAVVGVQFQLDGVALGAEDTTAPYSVSWNTATSMDGSHALTAIARDAAGNRTTSGIVTVTVNNSKRVRAQVTSQ